MTGMVDGPFLICPWSASHYMVDSRKIAAEEKWLRGEKRKSILTVVPKTA